MDLAREVSMFYRKLGGQALSLTWRFLLLFVMMFMPAHYMILSIVNDSAVNQTVVSNTKMFLFSLLVNFIVPVVMPYIAMYLSLLWYQRNHHV